MGMLQGGQGFFQVATPHVSAVDHAQGQHLVRWQAVENGRVLVRRTHQVDMQAIHRKVGSQAKVFFQAAEVSGHQFFQRVALDQVIGALESVLPILRQIERQDWLVDLHPLNAQFGQALEYLAIQRQQSLEQVEPVEVSALGLAQPQIGQRADHHGLDAVPQVEGFLDLFEELVPRQVELLIDAELRHQVVIVGVEPLGHLLGVEWEQIDEPILVLDLPQEWKNAFERAYNLIQRDPLKKLVATYFGGLEENLGLAANLPVDGLHIDLVRAPDQYPTILDRLPAYKVLSLGVVNGRNVWRCDLEKALATLQHAHEKLGDRLWVAPSCSLLHSPVDLGREDQLDAELKSWLAFAVQKCEEVAVLAQAVDQPEAPNVLVALAESRAVQVARAASPRIHKPAVQARVAAITAQDSQRQSPFAQRIAKQRAGLDLPLFPTTTIGSFPQTASIRLARQSYKAGKLSEAEYVEAMHSEIKHAVEVQENLGLDVLVHGEAERNDMVEYFAEQLDGYVFTRFGWVQSYGSRCVKPAVIFGDLSRPKAMTVEWIRYAQGLTDKVMKGMLTGPVTMLMWSFPREDVSREVQARQLALAIRDEVVDLEAAGIKIVQIDEAAFREGLPLRQAQWQHYLDWATEVFRLCASGVRDETQIHTHMCYSEFNDVIESIAAMDADVITIETSRSDMELLDAFEAFAYPNDIGPGVYDIHSPRVPDASEMANLLRKAAKRIPANRLWVNPDCGLKTRGWPETEAALIHMVTAARQLRAELA